jgi:predicted metal-binding membrane protein
MAAAGLALGAGRRLAPLICGDGAALFAAPELTARVAPWRMMVVWILMLLAMTPVLLVTPIRHVWDRTLASQRPLASACFALAYFAVWTLAGAPLISLMLLIRRDGPIALGVAITIAIVWQVSPVKQACLNRCHNRPTLSGFGPRGLRDALTYGLMQAAWCVAACWPLMLVPLVLPRYQLGAMVAISLFTAAERAAIPARPSWSARSTLFALRKAEAVVQNVRRWIKRQLANARSVASC